MNIEDLIIDLLDDEDYDRHMRLINDSVDLSLVTTLRHAIKAHIGDSTVSYGTVTGSLCFLLSTIIAQMCSNERAVCKASTNFENYIHQTSHAAFKQDHPAPPGTTSH